MKILICDVHASESGALSILDDLYKKICDSVDGSVEYLFVVSTPKYEEKKYIQVERYPWIKKSWIHRLYFDYVTMRGILKRFSPDKIYSLQNQGIPFFNGEQDVYLHLPFILCDYKFDLKKDGKRLWLYQNVLSKMIFSSLRKVSKVIVQTSWMKDALIEKGHIKNECIEIQTPDISMNDIGKFENFSENKKRFFYPATAFHYKNHMTVLKALKYAKACGLEEYEVLFTINENENTYTKHLSKYCRQNMLNVKFMGKISREEIFKLYTKSVLVFPSIVESFGLPLLEGRVSGTYILASDCPFSKEILNGYEKASFFEPFDYVKLGKDMYKMTLGG